MGIEICQLFKKYGDKAVLESVNMSIEQPGVYLVAGPNGSGKTTLLEIIVGLRKMDGGNVNIEDYSFDNVELKKKVGFLTQQNTLRKNCTVAEELNLVKQLFGLKLDTYEYLEKYNLKEFYHQKTKNLSGGTKRRVLIAMLLMPKYKIAVLDEPVSGLDTFSRDEIWNTIREYSQNNIVIVSDHYLNQAAQYSDYMFLLNKGRIVLRGSTEEILEKFDYDYVIKTRNKNTEDVEKELEKENILPDLKISGSVYNYFISSKDYSRIKQIHANKNLNLHPINLEDIYFYYTNDLIKNMEDI
ncbi:ABC transporter ATP-binding protein [Massilibacterium senegalense]|uniref:ABC transporter ATP-binding protein n=1 Tax=Massilibacterium senegalense TaxID=1632858 RepID=UPI000784C3FE|nr:ABC transporter ATP-binding protein [Massilibacterium senegalense]